MPRTTSEARELFESLVAGDESARRRYDRFMRYAPYAVRDLLVGAVAQGWDPSADVVASVLEVLPMDLLGGEARARIKRLKSETSVAHALRDALRDWDANAGLRASAYSQERYREYERYRDDPLVKKPRERGMDVAMFRPLND